MLLFLLAACGTNHQLATTPDANGATDAAIESSDGGTSAVPMDAAVAAPWVAVPTDDLKAINMLGTCTSDYRGWTLDNADKCTSAMGTNTGPASRGVTLASTSTGIQATTNLHNDPLTNNPTWIYTVSLSQAEATVEQGDTASCDPIYGTCVHHTWTLGPHSLVLVVHSLHDNYSATPMKQCWEYSYAKLDCTFELEW